MIKTFFMMELKGAQETVQKKISQQTQNLFASFLEKTGILKDYSKK
jgi:hypothetical protein